MNGTQPNDVQARIAQLQEKGWTLAALADELGVTPNAMEKWKAGDRYPHLEKPVLDALDRLAKLRRIPKKKRYAKGSRQYGFREDTKEKIDNYGSSSHQNY
jgi:transcriptional regulator with XRE-family HTH domain